MVSNVKLKSVVSHLKKKKAFSLMELMIVLGVSGLMVASIYYTYKHVNSQNKAKVELERLVKFKLEIYKIYVADTNYDQLTNTIIASSGIFGTDIPISADGEYVNDWSQPYFIGGSNQFPNTNYPKKTFGIVTYVPHEICTYLVPLLKTNFNMVSVGTLSTVDWSERNNIPLAEAVSHCGDKDHNGEFTSIRLISY